MNANKRLVGTLIVIVIISGFFLIRPLEDKKEDIRQATTTKKKSSPKIAPERKRDLASIPKKEPKLKKKLTTPVKENRHYIGSFKDINEISFSNQTSSDWEDKYKKRFKKSLYGKEIKNFKIEKKRSVVRVRKNVGTNLEHVVVSFTRPDGNPFSFEAYINSETGQLVKSWNKTRYEYKKPYKIEGMKYLYKKETP